MRVVMDALVSSGAPAGVGRYIAELAAAYGELFLDDDLVALVSAGRSLAGARSVPVLPPTPSSARRLLYEQTRLAARIRAEKPDVVHFPDYQRPQGFVGPSVVTVHDLAAFVHPEAFTRAAGRVKRTLMRLSLPRADRVIVPSEATRRDLIARLGVAEDKIRVVPHGVTLPPEGPAARRTRPYFLYVGTLEPRKNVVRLLEAYGMLAAESRAAPDLVIAGARGWLTDAIDAALSRLRAQGLSDRVQELGYVDECTRVQLMRGAVAFCYPSLYEGFGLPILEAMAAGVPVLTARGGATEEVSGGAALLVDPADAAAIAAGMRALADLSGPERDRRTAAGRARAQQLTWTATASATRAVYREAVDVARRR